MTIREADINDIPRIQYVRYSVKENELSDPSKVTDADCEEYLTKRGKGWVCEEDGNVVGFAIADLQDHNLWALFVQPEYEGRGFGRRLHDTLLDWYFTQTQTPIWLSTAPGTRAEEFYRECGWKETGTTSSGEKKFEMGSSEWSNRIRDAEGIKG